MTNKQTILTHLAPYRDKTLSFGCEVRVGIDEFKHRCRITSVYANGSGFKSNGLYEKLGNDDIDTPPHEILGHPLTHADLLRAMEEMNGENGFTLSSQGQLFKYNDVPDHDMNSELWIGTNILIPLTHRTIEDIPEDDPMWTQLLEVFNLK